MNNAQFPLVWEAVVARSMSPMAQPGTERLLYGRGSERFAGVPFPASNPNDGARDVRTMQPPNPGSLTMGCWKSATFAVRAMIALGESTWTRFVRQFEEKPAPMESPTHAMRVRSTCAHAVDAGERAATAARAREMRRRDFRIFMVLCAPSERRLESDARQDRERLVRGAEVVLARRDRPLVEPGEEARDLEFEVLRDGDPGSDMGPRAVGVRQEHPDIGVGLRRLVVTEAARDPAARAHLVGQAHANGPRVLPAVRQGRVGKAVDLENGLVEDLPRRVGPVRFERQLRRELVGDAEHRDGGELERRPGPGPLAEGKPRLLRHGGVELRAPRGNLSEFRLALEIDVHVRVVGDTESQAFAGLEEEARGQADLDRRSLGHDAHVGDVHDTLGERVHGRDVLAEPHVREADLGAGADRDRVRELEGELDRHRELAQIVALADEAARERVLVLPGHAEAVRRPEARRELHAVAQRQHAVPVTDSVKPLAHARRVAVARVRALTVKSGRGPEDREAAALQGEAIDERVSGGVVEHRRRVVCRGGESPRHRVTFRALLEESEARRFEAARRPGGHEADEHKGRQPVSNRFEHRFLLHVTLRSEADHGHSDRSFGFFCRTAGESSSILKANRSQSESRARKPKKPTATAPGPAWAASTGAISTRNASDPGRRERSSSAIRAASWGAPKWATPQVGAGRLRVFARAFSTSFAHARGKPQAAPPGLARPEA